jgi:AcrR family transcriptional regulator
LRRFREQGYDATTIEQIIDAADVSETTFFRYFPVKEDLVLDNGYNPMLIEAFQTQPPEVPPVQALRAAFAATFAGVTAWQQAEQNERIALTLTVPRLRLAADRRANSSSRPVWTRVRRRLLPGGPGDWSASRMKSRPASVNSARRRA